MPRARRKPRWLGPAAPSCTPHPQLPRPHFRERLSYGEAPPRRLGRRGCRDEEGDSGAKGRRGNSRPGNGGAQWPTRGARGQACGRPTPWAGPPDFPTAAGRWLLLTGPGMPSTNGGGRLHYQGGEDARTWHTATVTVNLSPPPSSFLPSPDEGPSGPIPPPAWLPSPPPPPLKPQRHERQHTAGGEAADALTRPCGAA